MKEHIQQVIRQLEIDYDLKVLYACEAGSRAWGFPAKDSDYDVRFIYVNRKEWYLSIDEERDTIEIPSRDRISIPIDEKLDVSGWELKKALRLLRKSNPAIFEWLHSSIIYDENYSIVEQMRLMSEEIFSPIVGLKHYLQMGKGNFRACLQENEINIKKYLNVLRPIFAAEWIVSQQTSPPVSFHTLLKATSLPGEVKEEVNKIIQHKMAGDEWGIDVNKVIIQSFIQKETDRLEKYAKTLEGRHSDLTEKLNRFFRHTLENAWC